MSQQHKVGTHATTVRMNDGVLSVVYHQTEVVKATPTQITLNHGGYRTNTTKTRMNQASNQYGLNYRVFQQNYDWYVWINRGTPEAKTIPFDSQTITFERPNHA